MVDNQLHASPSDNMAKTGTPEVDGAAQSAANNLRTCVESMNYGPGSGYAHAKYDKAEWLEQGDQHQVVAERQTNPGQVTFFNLDGDNNHNGDQGNFAYKADGGSIYNIEQRHGLLPIILDDKTTKLAPGSDEYQKAEAKLDSLKFDVPWCTNGKVVSYFVNAQKNDPVIKFLNKVFPSPES